MKFATLKIRHDKVQATRHEPAREVIQYDVRIPDGSFCEWMSCKSLEEATQYAARQGYTLQGDAGQIEMTLTTEAGTTAHQDAQIRETREYLKASEALSKFKARHGNKFLGSTTKAAERYRERLQKLEDAVSEAFYASGVRLGYIKG